MFDDSFFLVGMFISVVGIYAESYVANSNSTRSIIGSIMMAIWILAFPFASMEKKVNIIEAVFVRLMIFVIGFPPIVYVCAYIKKKPYVGTLVGEVNFCFLGVIGVTCFLYLLMETTIAFFCLLSKVEKYVFPKARRGAKTVLNILKGIASFVASLTPLFTCIVSIIKVMKA